MLNDFWMKHKQVVYCYCRPHRKLCLSCSILSNYRTMFTYIFYKHMNQLYMLFSPLSDSQPYKQLRAITRSELTQPLSTYQETHHPHTSRFWDCYSLHTTHSQISPDRQYSLAGRSSPDSSVSAFPQSPPNPDICHG